MGEGVYISRPNRLVVIRPRQIAKKGSGETERAAAFTGKLQTGSPQRKASALISAFSVDRQDDPYCA
ncbi:hypothetical protein AA105894_0144 [Asaia spathodeae NBRC 105894]|nr:hypothetical protein AA105894_0144 [Asaia spathodeae NBRC 105894]